MSKLQKQLEATVQILKPFEKTEQIMEAVRGFRANYRTAQMKV